MGNKKLFGFTLSEVLIALTIIGIISAVTVPSMVMKYQRRAQLLQIHKVYADFSQVIGMFAVEDSGQHIYRSKLSLRGAGSVSSTAGRFLKKYFQVTQDCGTTVTPCFAASYRNQAGTFHGFTCSGYSVVVENGSAICLYPADTDSPAEVYVDTNGAKEPNISGRDIFRFYIYDDGSIDEGVSHEQKKGGGTSPRSIRATVANSCTTSSFGEGCLAKIINDNWEMNY